MCEQNLFISLFRYLIMIYLKQRKYINDYYIGDCGKVNIRQFDTHSCQIELLNRISRFKIDRLFIHSIMITIIETAYC